MSQASIKTDWEDRDIGVCACGQERRLFRPLSFADAPMCSECVRRWLIRHEPQDPLREDPEQPEAKKAVHWRERRRQLIAAGRCITCVRRPAMVERRCYGCHNKKTHAPREPYRVTGDGGDGR